MRTITPVGCELVRAHVQVPLGLCAHVCAWASMCASTPRVWGSVPTPLKHLTLAQHGSSLGGSHTGSHQGCWRSCSYRVPAVLHTHPHPGSLPGSGRSQSQRDRRSGSHPGCCGRRHCRRPWVTVHIHSYLRVGKRRERMWGAGGLGFASPGSSTRNTPSRHSANPAFLSEPKANVKTSMNLPVSFSAL